MNNLIFTAITLWVFCYNKIKLAY